MATSQPGPDTLRFFFGGGGLSEKNKVYEISPIGLQDLCGTIARNVAELRDHPEMVKKINAGYEKALPEMHRGQ